VTEAINDVERQIVDATDKKSDAREQ